MPPLHDAVDLLTVVGPTHVRDGSDPTGTALAAAFIVVFLAALAGWARWGRRVR